MAIRKAGTAGRVKAPRPVQVGKAAEAPKKTSAEVLKDLKADLQKATAPGPGRSAWLSEAEAQSLLERAKAGGPEVENAFKQELKAALESGQLGGKELQLGDAALKAVAAFAEVAAGTFRTVVADKDKTAEHQLAEGLAKTKVDVSQADVVATKNQLDELKLQGQQGAAVSKKEFTPHYKAAKAVGEELKNAAKAHLEENHPAAAAAVNAVGSQVEGMITDTVANLARDPEAQKRLAGVLEAVGKEGFAKAVSDFAPDVGKAFTAATGVPAVNTQAAGALLENLPKIAEKVAPKSAGKIAETCAKVAGKLGVETAGAAVEAGAKAAGKAVAKEGAEVAAKTGAKAAASAGKAVPGLGNAISVGSACLAGVGFVKSLFASPRDGESIAKNGLNTLLQTVGIVFPWAGLAGDLIDMGWSAKKAVTDGQKGKPAEQGLSKQDAAGLVADPARLLAEVLSGAGQPGVAKAFNDLAAVTERSAGAGELERHQLDALSQFAQLANQETTKAAAQEEDPMTRDALKTVAHGFGEIFKVVYQHKKAKPDDELKRGDIKAQLLRVTGDVAMGLAALKVGGKGATLSVLDD